MKKAKIITFSVVAFIFCLIPAKLMSLSKKIESARLSPYVFHKESKETKGVKIGFYGTSCLTFTYKGSTFLNDPFFSNPNYFQIVAGRYEDRSSLIQPVLKDMDSIAMVSITHGHYDHCMDFPEFLSKYESNAKFISSSSTLRSLSPWIKEQKNWRQYHIERLAQPNWIYSENKIFRIYPIKSVHQPHIGNKVLFSGENESPLEKTPGPVWQWLEGGTFSFLVDVMDDQKVVSRFLIVSGKMEDESLQLVQELTTDQKIDIMFIPYFDKNLTSEPFVHTFEQLQPKEVVFHHWNNFFKTPEKPLQKLRASDIENEVKLKKEQGYPVSVMIPFTQTTI